MGRLNGLELYNFKSYKGTVKFGLGTSDFTSIIGPNGSGKSNMMDAISFVLGVRSSHLRSNALKDLIYRDRISSLDKENQIPENEQKEVDNNIENDNSETIKAYVKAFYTKNSENTPTVFERDIRSNGDSVYKIDGKQVNFKNYSKVLENENILIKARNFLVFQGDVENIASQSSQQLTRLLEEISGSIEYKNEYDELNVQHRNALKDLTDSNFKKRRLQTELNQYREDVSKDQQYVKSFDESKKIWIEYSLWQLYHLEAKRDELKDRVNSGKEEIKNLKKTITSEEKIFKKGKAALAKIELKITNKEDFLRTSNTTIEKKNAQLLPIRSNKESLNKKIHILQRRIESYERDINRQKEYIESFNHQLRVVSNTKNSFEQEIKNSSNEKYQLSEEQLKEYAELKDRYLATGGLKLEENIQLKNNEKLEINDEVQKINEQMAISEDRIHAYLEPEEEKVTSKITDLVQSLNDKNEAHSKYSSELKSLQTSIQSLNNKEVEISYRLRDVLVKIDDLSASQRESRKEKNLRENVNTLKRLFPGVKGLVYDLCKPKRDKYSTAVSTVLGKNFDSVVVDSVITAQQCISYLKEQRSGYASFIPLDTVDVFPPRRLQLDNCVLTIDAIDYANELEKAMQYVCSNSIICDNMGIAKDLKWNRKINAKLVTLDGSLIHKSGLMTGGVSQNNSGNRWDKEEYKSLISLKDKLAGDVSKLNDEVRIKATRSRELETILSVLNNEISTLRSQINHSKRNLNELEIQINYHRELIENEYRSTIAVLQSKLESCDEEIKAYENEKEELQNRSYEQLTSKLNFSIHEYEKNTGETLRQQSKELQQLEKQKMDILNKIAFEKERLLSTEDRRDHSKSEVKRIEGKLAELDSEEHELLSIIEEKKTEEQNCKNEIGLLNEEYQNSEKHTKSIEDRINEYISITSSKKRESAIYKEDIEQIDQERVDILKNCQMSNIELPLLTSSLDELPVDRVDEDVLNIARDIKINYSLLPAKFKENGSSKIREEFEGKIAEIDEILSTLQPNFHASERLGEVQGKFGEIDSAVKKLRAKENSLATRFETVKRQRRELFIKAFEHAQEHIDVIYKELTKDPHYNVALGGGSASLTLEDEDEPYLAGIRYHATPPLKRFKEMQYLSGGEKTVAALALLFAINSYQQSPFFILDEIDAALDISNVEKIARYIKKYSKINSQFIVISLKNTMFEKSDALIGVFRQQNLNSSRVLTLDLSGYS
ncbi:related to Structural maintenance of chromosomes protein 1 [Saccharomycodes ludwigii]|uniref:Structural maintenance of chromosomes protein n=1 Tax=Saccharomycodes ludwigii TaxID=36035 RepID=A0A376B1A5_9ASCO|nr:hypothetical protein SCDLUD_000697 [Saccharomycodes ludwigii]KAH3903086.1 hypothetical protein SCDLUD_000697 [Saccharomycodes ludwigii]SSD58421.1 related to Structural maintenance of chromosomes protein 1 [Saccharomycodes ludwigii]